MHALLASLTGGHRLLHRVSGGRLGRRFPGGQRIVWIDTLGRRSGQWRRTPLLAVADTADTAGPSGPAGGGGGCGAAYVVAGSNGGQGRVPGWVFNAQAHPRGFLEVDGQHWVVSFEQAHGDDRDRLYAALVASWHPFDGYARRAGRPIPVFRVRLLARSEPPPSR